MGSVISIEESQQAEQAEQQQAEQAAQSEPPTEQEATPEEWNIVEEIRILREQKNNQTTNLNSLSFANRKYGWKRDKLDPRDHYRTFKHPTLGYPLTSSKVDLRNKCPHVYDQGSLGSCTANAIAFAYEYDQIKQHEVHIFTPSRLFIYYNERTMEGTVDYDAGAEIRDGIKSVNMQGICTEQEWPYNIYKFTVKPDNRWYEEGKKNHRVAYKRINMHLDEMKNCLHNGLPFVFGFVVCESFEQIGRDGVMMIPDENEDILGGHAVAAVGYDDNMEANGEKGYFIIRNSWGKNWGTESGHFYMPYNFITNPKYCSDFWTIERITDPKPIHPTKHHRKIN